MGRSFSRQQKNQSCSKKLDCSQQRQRMLKNMGDNSRGCEIEAEEPPQSARQSEPTSEPRPSIEHETSTTSPATEEDCSTRNLSPSRKSQPGEQSSSAGCTHPETEQLDCFPTFQNFPYDIKYIIWGFVIRQQRVVEAEGSIEEIEDHSLGGHPLKLRINLSPSCKFTGLSSIQKGSQIRGEEGILSLYSKSGRTKKPLLLVQKNATHLARA
jgi:hypothetical protein